MAGIVGEVLPLQQNESYKQTETVMIGLRRSDVKGLWLEDELINHKPNYGVILSFYNGTLNLRTISKDPIEYDNTFKMHSCSNNTINTILYNLKLRFNLLILKRKGH